jgi:serine/threonine protein kinase
MQLLRRLRDCPNILTFYDTFIDNSTKKLYIVTDLDAYGIGIDWFVNKVENSRQLFCGLRRLETMIWKLFIQAVSAIRALHELRSRFGIQNPMLFLNLKPKVIRSEGWDLLDIQLGDFTLVP